MEQKQALGPGRKKESERQRTLGRELEWIRMSPKGRRSKSKARITAYENLLNQQSEGQRRYGDLHPTGTAPGQAGREAEGLCKGYEGKLLVDNLSFSLPPGGTSASLVPTAPVRYSSFA